MIHIDFLKGETKISGNMTVILSELEEVARKVRLSLSDNLGEKIANETMQFLFDNSMLSEDERDSMADRDMEKADSETKAEFERFMESLLRKRGE